MSDAEIHVLPTMRLATPQVSRIVTELTEAHAAGVDLGSRVPHIQANSDALLDLHDDLERELAGLWLALSNSGAGPTRWGRAAAVAGRGSAARRSGPPLPARPRLVVSRRRSRALTGAQQIPCKHLTVPLLESNFFYSASAHI